MDQVEFERAGREDGEIMSAVCLSKRKQDRSGWGGQRQLGGALAFGQAAPKTSLGKFR